MKAWGQIIALIMDDKYNPPEPPEFLSNGFNVKPCSANSDKDPLANDWKNEDFVMKTLKEKTRTPEWYHAAGEKLALSVRTIAAAQKNSHWRVRLELASACHFLLLHCCRYVILIFLKNQNLGLVPFIFI